VISGDRFTAADRAAYLEAWSQPGALTGGLNWYRAAGVGRRLVTARPREASVTRAADRALPTLVVWASATTRSSPATSTGSSVSFRI